MSQLRLKSRFLQSKQIANEIKNYKQKHHIKGSANWHAYTHNTHTHTQQLCIRFQKNSLTTWPKHVHGKSPNVWSEIWPYTITLTCKLQKKHNMCHNYTPSPTWWPRKVFLKFHGLTAFWWRKLPQCTNFFVATAINFTIFGWIILYVYTFCRQKLVQHLFHVADLLQKGWSHAH